MRARPAIALTLPALAWFVFEVGLGSVVGSYCTVVGRWAGPLWGAISLALCAVAGLIAWPLAKHAGARDEPRPWLAQIAVLAAGIFALAILYQTLATLIVPSCA